MKNTEAILVTPRVMGIEEYSMSVSAEDEVSIKVAYVGICGSDIHGSECGPFIPPKDPLQKIRLGHELSGTVMAMGVKVTRFKEGGRILCELGVPYGKCEFCLGGHYSICSQVGFMAAQPNYKGALTNYLTHPESFTYHLPTHMDMVERALVKPIVVGIHTVKFVGVKPGKSVLILGTGCVRLMTLQACVFTRAKRVVAADVVEWRLEKAPQLGAWHVINEGKGDTVDRSRTLFDGNGVGIVFEIVGSRVTTTQSFVSVRRGEEVMIVRAIPEETPVDFPKINREVKVRTVFRYVNSFPMTIQAISSGRFGVLTIITDGYTYEDVQETFERSLSRKVKIIKGVIKIGD